MTRVDFDSLVGKVESSALRHPARLRLSTAFWAFTGYSGFLILLLLVWVPGAAFCIGGLTDQETDNTIPMLVFGVLILVIGTVWVGRMLWVGLNEPDGVPVTAEEAPRLMEEINLVRAAMGARRVHRVLLTAHCNAGACELPRMLFAGRPRNYLLLGLPVMDELGPDEFRAVLAHEFSHLSARHGRFGGWIYRLRRTWGQIFTKWESGACPPGLLRPLIQGFVRWWWPRFNARAFVLSRLCEYEADRAAARLTSPEHITRGLLRIGLLAAVIDGPVQRRLLQQAATDAVPLPDYTLFVRGLRAAGMEEADRAVKEAWLIPTRYDDTHPSLTDRSQATGAALPADEIPEPVAHSAAQEFLAGGLESIRRKVDALWVTENTASWQSRHLAAIRLNLLMESIGTKGRGENAELLWEEAKALESLHGPEAALPVLEKILAFQPRHPDANLAMGGHLLQTVETARGEACLETAMAAAQTLHAAAGLLHHHYRRTGQTERLRMLDARLDSEENNRAAAEKELGNVMVFDKFIPHTLTVEECSALLPLFEATPGLAAVDLGQKLLRHSPEQRLFILCLHGQGGFAGVGAAEKAAAALRHLTSKVRLPGRLLMVAAGGPLAGIARKITRQPNARIWRRVEEVK